jgi:hypothetical protein
VTDHGRTLERAPAVDPAEEWEAFADDEYRADPMARLGARPLGEVECGPPPPLLLDRLHPRAHTVLYGAGGSRKGTVAASWIARLRGAGHRVLIADYEDHPEEWAGRVRSLGGPDAAGGVLHVSPLGPSWRGARGALWEQAPDLRELAAAWAATVLVVDSIVVACGGADPMDPGTPAQYGAGLQQIGVPTLSLAHVTKEGSLLYPFGSVFWHNLARVTWSLEKDGARSVLHHRKYNEGDLLGRFVVDVTYRGGLPGEVWERAYSAVLADRIADALGDGPATVAELAARFGDEAGEDGRRVKEDSIRAALRRGLREERFTAGGPPKAQRWGLR